MQPLINPCDTFCPDTEENRKRYSDLGYTYIDKLNRTDRNKDTQHFLVATTVAGREVSFTTYILNCSFKNYDDLLQGINFDKVILGKHQVDELERVLSSFEGEINNREMLEKITVNMNKKLIEDFGITGYHYQVTGHESTVNCILCRIIDNRPVKLFPNTISVEEKEPAKADCVENNDITIFEITKSTQSMLDECGEFIMSELSTAYVNNESKSIRVDLDINGKILVTIL